jgi:hypothetical protein
MKPASQPVPDDASGSDAGRGRMQVKVYLVLQRVGLPRNGEANVRILAARLTRTAAQSMVDKIPGTFVEKHLAMK